MIWTYCNKTMMKRKKVVKYL